MVAGWLIDCYELITDLDQAICNDSIIVTRYTMILLSWRGDQGVFTWYVIFNSLGFTPSDPKLSRFT